MSDHEDGGTHGCIQLMKGFHEHQGGFGIQGAGGFVSKNQFWSGYQCAGTGTALFLTAGYLIGEFGEGVFDTKLNRHIVDFFLNGKSIRMIDSEGQADIFFQSQGIEKVKILKNKDQPFPAETLQFTGE